MDKTNKTELIAVRVNQTERMAFELMAQQEQVKKSEFLRELIRETAKQRGLWPLGKPAQEQQQALRETA